MSEAVERTAEEKAQMYSAMLGSVSVITNCLDDSNEFCNDMTKAEKKERVMRSSGYLSIGFHLSDRSSLILGPPWPSPCPSASPLGSC